MPEFFSIILFKCYKHTWNPDQDGLSIDEAPQGKMSSFWENLNNIKVWDECDL